MKLTAVKFRLGLVVFLVLASVATVALFAFGYQSIKDFGVEVSRRQADATASEDSVGSLQRLQLELQKLSGVTSKLNDLRSTNSLPQFDTERSIRTLADQLGIPITSVTFVNGGGSGSTGGTTQGSAGGTQPSTPATGGANSKITFEFAQSLSYTDLIRFLDAIETSTPKLFIDGITIPAGSSRQSINPGVITLTLDT
jgi:hypothetical protein